MKKTIKLSKSEFGNYIREMVRRQVSLMGCEEDSFTNYPIRCFKPRFERMADNNELDEGLIRTYPSEWVEEYLSKRINTDFIKASFDEIYCHFWFILKPGSKSIDSLIKKMDSFGYYCAVEDNVKEGVYLQFEPKFDEYFKGSELSFRFSDIMFYHVAPSHFKEKILKYGLVPKSKNGFLKYPDRVYLMRATSSGEKDVCELASELYDKSANKLNNGFYSLFGIKSDGLEDVKFYTDMNMPGSDAFFTYENIPPENIVFIKDFNISEV